jgi:uncharacterized paraquat-inducible protein A
MKQLDEQTVTRLQLDALKRRAETNPQAAAFLDRLKASCCSMCGRTVMTVDGKKAPCTACQRRMAREQRRKLREARRG